MPVLLVSAILFLAGVVLCYLATTSGSWKLGATFFMASIASFGAAAHLSRHAPYVAVAGVAVLILSALRFVPATASRTLAASGAALVLSGLVVVIAGLFKNPSDDVETEDREGYTPPVIVDKTPQGLLAKSWSTYDKHCDWPVADLMLALSEAAYKPPVEARELIQKLGFRDSESISGGSMQGYVIDAGEESIIALRGTEHHEYDILQDLRFLRVKSEQGSMHGGFVKGYNPMHEQINALLDRYEAKRVWVTGHSLGGALAIVCAHRLLVDGKHTIAGVMTFGQPKVARQDTALFLGPELDGKYVFFVNDMDPITRLIDPYVHFGHMVRWTDSEIERSRRSVLTTSRSDQDHSSEGLPLETGYVESMSDEQLEELIRELEESDAIQFDGSGNPKVRGALPSGSDHFLDSYKHMLEMLRTHSA